MTNEIEKKFFDAFGIKPEHSEYCYHECRIPELANIPCNKKNCPHYRIDIDYPAITDRILLKLICLLVAHYWKTKEHYYLTALDEECLRKEILNDACYVIDGMLSREKEVDFINQVRTLFGEGEEE